MARQLHPLLLHADDAAAGRLGLRVGAWGDADPANPYDWLPAPGTGQACF